MPQAIAVQKHGEQAPLLQEWHAVRLSVVSSGPPGQGESEKNLLISLEILLQISNVMAYKKVIMVTGVTKKYEQDVNLHSGSTECYWYFCNRLHSNISAGLLSALRMTIS
ncbi:hypothetical protein GCM10009413_20100 [Tatumella punctata]